MSVPVDLQSLRADAPGELPADGAAHIAGVALPAGRRLPLPGIGAEAFWVSSQPIDDPWPLVRDLINAFPRTGLWPMRIGWQSREEDYPWGGHLGRWAHDPTPATRAGIDILHDRWRAEIEGARQFAHSEDPDDTTAQWLEAFQPWPGATSPAQPGSLDEVTPLGGNIWHPETYLVLTSCRRPADALLVLSPAEYNSRPDAADTVAVLRSWEDRYGTLPLTFGGDTLELAVRRPPRTRAEARRVACEVLGFCTDFHTAYDDAEELFAALIDTAVWSFWWD